MYSLRVKRTQIYLDEDLDRRLRETAAAEGRSAAALIREAVGRYLLERPVSDDDPLGSLIGAFSGRRTDSSERHDEYLYGQDDAIG
jgi:plasmid stability protein